MSNHSPRSLDRSLGVLQGVALSVGAVVGVSILALPAMTAREAGPAALLSWLAMSLLSFPVVLCIARLAVAQPSAGGVLDYVSKAFGKRVGGALGVTFLGTIPIGMPVISIIGARYGVHAMGLPQSSAIWIALGAATLAVCLNALGVKFAGWVQVAVVALVVALLLACSLAALPLIDPGNLTPFAPKGSFAVISATVPIFFSFVGWEMVAPLAEEFRTPEKDLEKSLIIAVFVVATLYLTFAFVTIATGAYRHGDGVNAFAMLAEQSMGRVGLYITTILACLVAYASLHVNVTGFSRMLYAQAREGRLPASLARLSATGKTPVTALLISWLLFIGVFSIIALFDLDLQFLIKWPATVFIFAYLLTMAAAIVLLKKSDGGWTSALTGFVFCATAFVSAGLLMLFPLILFTLGYIFSFRSRSI